MKRIQKILLSLGALVLSSLVSNADNLDPNDPAYVYEVSFSGEKYTQLSSDLKDDTEEDEKYKAPQWKKEGGERNGELKNRSISYVRKSKPKIKAKIKLPGCPDDTQVTVKVTASVGGDVVMTWAESELISVKDATINFPAIQGEGGEGGEALDNGAESETDFPDSVQFYNRSDPQKAFILKWEVRIGNAAEFTEVGKTEHQVYVTLEAPSLKKNRETLFYMACAGATGMKNKDDLVGGINQDHFYDCQIALLDPKTGKPGYNPVEKKPELDLFLNYYGETPRKEFPTSGLQDHPFDSGRGVCGIWADLLIEVYSVHGIVSQRYGLWPSGVKSSSPGSDGADSMSFFLKEAAKHVDKAGQDVENSKTFFENLKLNGKFKLQGLHGDNSGNGQALDWAGHCIVLYTPVDKATWGQGVYIDPSYGGWIYYKNYNKEGKSGKLNFNNSLGGFTNYSRLWLSNNDYLDIK